VGVAARARQRVVLPLVRRLNAAMRRAASWTHRWQFWLEWVLGPSPEWFDHYLDSHYSWTARGIPYPWERGIFNLLAMKQGCEALEICCGDGFNTHHFYACRAARIVAVDIDPVAVTHARCLHAAPHVTFAQCDIRDGLPSGIFDNVLWDAAIEHFTEHEIDTLIKAIRARLRPGGVLSGHTIRERESGKSHPDHEYEFRSKPDLLRFFEGRFKNVLVFETIYPDRHNFYFFASDGELPFSENWPHAVRRGADASVA
jgi:SAM-dependent methyltransferase